MKKHLKSNWSIYTIGAFGGFIGITKIDYWWVYIILFGLLINGIEYYFKKVKKKDGEYPLSNMIDNFNLALKDILEDLRVHLWSPFIRPLLQFFWYLFLGILFSLPFWWLFFLIKDNLKYANL
tara:strand:+ start:127 stop:495 length:369 start_codon:yes stop_codon:yes gene_type:complete